MKWLRGGPWAGASDERSTSVSRASDVAASLSQQRFAADWLVNFASLGVLAISGLLLNTLIVRDYDIAALGTFMQVLAIFLIAAQLATLGIQYSILQASAAHGVSDEVLASILLSGLAPVLASGGAAAALAAAVATLWSGSELGTPLLLASPGLALCAVNKCLLSFLNGIHRNQAVALLNAVRPLAIVAILIVLILLEAPAWAISLSLAVEEAILFGAASAVITSKLDLRRGKVSMDWVRRHVAFGWRSMPGGIAAEANTRADVLLLGLFVSPAQVGLYAFAQSVVEGVMQLPQITRRIIDPICARLVVEERHGELHQLSRRIFVLSAAGFVTIGVAAVAAYPMVIGMLLGGSHADEQWPLFSILMLGAVISATYTGFSGYLMQSGRPGMQTWLEIVLLAVNAFGCLLLAPLLGAVGAAIAKSTAYAAHGFGLRLLIHRYLRLRL